MVWPLGNRESQGTQIYCSCMIHESKLKHSTTSWKTETVSTTRATPIAHPSRHHKRTRCDHNMHPAWWPGSGNTRQYFQLHCTGAKDNALARHDWLGVEGHDLRKMNTICSTSKRTRDPRKFFILTTMTPEGH